MTTFPKILAVATLIAIPAFAQTPDSATTNPPATAVGSGTAKALQSSPPAATPQHDSTNTKATHPKHATVKHPRRTPRAAA
jgi:hypothetical protein